MTEPFWEGTRAGKLLLQRCRDCGHWRWTPQLACPACWSEAYEWSEASGRGSLYSYTLIHRPVDPARFEAPYLLAIVALEEGPHMLTNLVECTPEQARIDMPVEVRFERLDDEFTVYPFAPAKASLPTSRGD
ncbi:MAG: Zn-ribbon domain-containing OB-fold protein [Deltaproteobacteria bacterium]|nr:Zn-ribbon domain-containing OB-fold protein [Deltaproteobacteria bacterium]